MLASLCPEIQLRVKDLHVREREEEGEHKGEERREKPTEPVSEVTCIFLPHLLSHPECWRGHCVTEMMGATERYLISGQVIWENNQYS